MVILAGIAASFIALGIGRFAYTALMPALIQHHWFTPYQASLLGAGNLAGYLIGAISANFIAQRLGGGMVLRASMLICALSFILSAHPILPFLWVLSLRIIAGITGGWIIVVVSPLLVKQFPLSRQGAVTGYIFSGIGIGVFAAGTLFPHLLEFGVAVTWLGLGGMGAVLSLIFWLPLKRLGAADIPQEVNATSSPHIAAETLSKTHLIAKRGLVLLMIFYGLDALGYVPHSLFWVDYLVRELDYSFAEGGRFWALFGLGAAIGPLCAGYAGDFFGFKKCLMAAALLKASAVLTPVLIHHGLALGFSSFMVGALTPGMVTLVSAYSRQMAGADGHRKAWGRMTFSFAFAQAIGGVAMANIAPFIGVYAPLFLIGSASLMLGFFVLLLIKPQAD